MFGEPGETTNKYPSKKTGDFAKLSMGGTPNTKHPEYYGGDINWMKSGDIKENYVCRVPTKITQLGLESSNAKIYPKNSVVIALNGQGKTRGSTAILKINTSSNQSVACIEPDLNVVTSEYLHFNLKMRYKEIRNITGDNDRSGLNLTILRNFSVPLPPLPLQQKFARVVEKIESMRQSQNQSKQQIEDLFSALMQKAFRGEI
jgi:type I restriction enzyme S subunit